MIVIPIFLIDSKKESIDVKDVNDSDIVDFGNGFFISNTGLLASVAHVISKKGAFPYSIINSRFQKIQIVEDALLKISAGIDAAIGRIDCEDIDFGVEIEFEKVKVCENLKIIGLSRHRINNDEAKEIGHYSIGNFELTKYEISTLCLDNRYSPSQNEILSSSFFTFELENEYKGLSGSPVINEKNKIVGILKGCAIQDTSLILGLSIHIEILTPMLNKINR